MTTLDLTADEDATGDIEVTSATVEIGPDGTIDLSLGNGTYGMTARFTIGDTLALVSLLSQAVVATLEPTPEGEK